jgi:hypothetical protein
MRFGVADAEVLPQELAMRCERLCQPRRRRRRPERFVEALVLQHDDEDVLDGRRCGGQNGRGGKEKERAEQQADVDAFHAALRITTRARNSFSLLVLSSESSCH